MKVPHTNNSAALPVNTGLIESAGNDILSGDAADGRGKEDASRNGLRDTGLGGASMGEVSLFGEPGDTARLRKGLLEERLRE